MVFRPAQPHAATGHAGSVVGDFGVGTVELRGRRYGLQAGDGRFVVRESLITGRERERVVQYTLGSRRIQHYLTRSRMAASSCSRRPGTCSASSGSTTWRSSIPRSRRALHLQVWNTNCFGCHVSGEAKNFDAANDTYGTDWHDFGTGCERCHGPGRRTCALRGVVRSAAPP